MRSDGTQVERLCDVITLLKRQPYTAAELGKRLDVKASTARRWCEILAYKGHVTWRPTTVRGQQARAWEWA